MYVIATSNLVQPNEKDQYSYSLVLEPAAGTLPWVPEVFFSLGATELSGEATMASREAARNALLALTLLPLASEKTSGIQGTRTLSS